MLSKPKDSVDPSDVNVDVVAVLAEGEVLSPINDFTDKISLGEAPDITKGGLNEGVYDWTAPEFRDIPDIVRSTVSFEDDPTMRCWSFRVVVLSTLFTLVGSTCSVIS